MKLIEQVIKKDTKHLLFLDLEGTQFEHEIIAIGAVLVDLDEENRVKDEIKTFKCYVKSKNNIGSVVERLTGIHKETLINEGLSFYDAMSKLSSFLGNSTSDLKILTYGTQDKIMLKTSLTIWNDHSPFLFSFVSYLMRNIIDVAPFITELLTQQKSNIISLTNARIAFDVEESGVAHDPLNDAIDLFNIYKVVSSKKDIVKECYLKSLCNSSTIPQPLKNLVKKLKEEGKVDYNDLEKEVNKYLR